MLTQITGAAHRFIVSLRLLLKGIYHMSNLNDVAGTAALSICESLMLALNDRDILPEHEIVGVLKDAVTAHENVPGDEETTALNAAVVVLINRIIDGGNSVRRP